MKSTGGCLCGFIKYTISNINLKAYHCHCEMCQKASGSIFLTYVNLNKNQLSWDTVEPSYYKSSTKARRGFCSKCGASICYELLVSEKIDMAVGSLDDKSKLKLVGHNGVESRLSSFEWKDDLPEFSCE